MNPHIKFTIELPGEDGYLPFLDCEICFDGRSFQSRLYAKPINGNTILHWNSNCPTSTKKAVLSGELRRAHYRSTCVSNVHYSINIIRTKFLNNGYPKRFVERCIQLFKRRVDGGGVCVERERSNKKYIKCPYANEEITRHYKSFFKRLGLSEKIVPWFHGGPPLKRIFHPPKEKLTCTSDCKFCVISEKPQMCHFKDVIYQIECQICRQIYIGETQRMIKSRINEHMFLNFSNSAVRDHFTSDHPNSEISVKWKILHFNVRHFQKRLVLESMYIKSVNPNVLMNNCNGAYLRSF